MSATTTPVHPTRLAGGPRAASWAARVLLGLLGVTGVPAVLYFTFFAAPEDGGVVSVVDWAVAVWAMVVFVGYVVVAVRLGPSRPGVHCAAVGLVLSHLAFGAVKLIGYGEAEAWMFGAFDVAALALLLLARPRHR